MAFEISKFEGINFDTQVTSVGYDNIDVSIDPTQILDGYSSAYESELHRRNPLKFNSSKSLSAKHLEFYFRYCVFKRLQCVNDECKNFRLVRSLYVPDWITFTLDKLGDAYYTNMGLRIHPVTSKAKDKVVESLESIRKELAKGYDFDKEAFSLASEISNQLRSFQSDGVGMSDNAFPRTKEGDTEVMSCALINDYVVSIAEVKPISTYVSAFLGLKLMEELKFQALYRIRYDDVQYVYNRILNEERMF